MHGTAPEFRHPDFVLREIHPVALADPIRAQARTVLLGGDYFDDGRTVRVKKTGNRDDLLAADIVICGRYETLQRLNQLSRLARDFIKGPVRDNGAFDPRNDYPREGERVVVQRSDELPRGEIATLWEPFIPGSTNAILLVHDGNGGLAEPTRVRFGGMPCPLPERAILNEIYFGYAISALEIQGAQWEHVLLIDEMPLDHPARPGWLYSAFCAAETTITIIRKHKTNT